MKIYVQKKGGSYELEKGARFCDRCNRLHCIRDVRRLHEPNGRKCRQRCPHGNALAFCDGNSARICRPSPRGVFEKVGGRNELTGGVRSILPDDPYTPDSAGLTFYLSGTSTTGKKLADKEVTLKLKDGSTDEFEFDTTAGPVTLESRIWNLVLTAYTDGATKAKPVLQGFGSVDLRNGSGLVSFTLSPEGLTTPADITITGKFKPNNNVSSYTMGIYKKNSVSEAIDEKIETYSGDGTTDESFTYTYASLEPGTYLYRMVFKNTDGTVTGSFTDTLIVYAGNALTQDIGTIDVVIAPPAPPTDFTVSLEDGSAETSSDDTYRVKLAWTSGGGETNFEVELTEYSDDGTTAATGYPKVYGMKAMDTDTPKTGVVDFQGSDVWASKGSAMTYGDEEAYFKLKLGVVYEMRIRARSAVGTSDWVDRTVATATTGFTPYGTEKINRMKVEYLLNGGTLTLYDANGNKTKTGNYTEYKNWAGTDLDLLKIDNTDEHANQLKKGESNFVAWKKEATDASPAITTSNYQNLSVIAFFGSSLSGDIGMTDPIQDVKLADITATYGSVASPGANPISLVKNGTYDIPKGTEVIKITLSTATTDYKNIKFRLITTDNPFGSDLMPDAAGNSCTLTRTDYDPGKIQVLVTADTPTNKGLTQLLIFNLQ